MIRFLRRPAVWISISLALLIFVAWRSRPWELGDRLAGADARPVILAVLLNAVIVVAWAARSSDLLAAAGRPVPIRPLIPLTAFANIVNNVTPGSVGELARLYLLRAYHGVDYTSGSAVILVERVIAIGYLGSSAAIAWAAWWLPLPWPVALALIGISVSLPSVLYRQGLRPSALLRGIPLGRALGVERWRDVRRSLEGVDSTIARLLGDPRRATMFAVLTTLVFGAYAAQLWLVAAAIGVHLDPAVAWGALGLGIVAGVVSLLPFGLGSADLVVASLLGAAGVAPAEAVAIVFGYRIVSTLPLALVGIVGYAMLSAGLPTGGLALAARSAREGLRDERPEPS